MKKLSLYLVLLMVLVLPMKSVFSEAPDVTMPSFPAEYAAEYEQAAAALAAHTLGAEVDYAVRERDDGRYEWELFFVLNGQLGTAEVAEEGFVVRHVRLYDLPEGGLTASQAMTELAKEKGIFQMIDLELDFDDGRLRYEGKVMQNEKRFEFELSITGTVIEWERD